MQEPKAGVPQERGLLARHTAAIQLLRQGREADGMLLLSYVVWPNATLENASRLGEPGCGTPSKSRSTGHVEQARPGRRSR